MFHRKIMNDFVHGYGNGYSILPVYVAPTSLERLFSLQYKM